MNLASVKVRFLVSVGGNVFRAAISFLSSLVVARGLTPAGYGDLTFLLGSFAAIRALLDMGTTNAFYTFIGQRPRSRSFYLLFCAWLAAQFVITLFLVAVILPQSMIDRVWLGHTQGIIILALAASFVQQPIWSAVVQIGESSRNTVKMQLVGMGLALLHFSLVLTMLYGGWLSVTNVMAVMIAEYGLAAVVALWLLRGAIDSVQPKIEVRETLLDYWKFCRPLVVLALMTFLYQFADRWLLQRFGGASQQGFYQVASQFATIGLLATMSIINIFWKEVAEANERKDSQRVAYLYHKVNRGLLMLGAVLASFLVPWAEPIAGTLLGAAYKEAWPTLAIMFLYPVHQSMGQVNATMFMACGRTGSYTKIGIIAMLVSVPLAYLVLAPTQGHLISGLDMGAFGMALKMLGTSILFVNIQAWMIARANGWRYEWQYQVVGIFSVLVLGYLAKMLTGVLLPAEGWSSDKLMLALSLATSGVFYAIGVAAFFWMLPGIIGMERAELRNMLTKLNPYSYLR